MSITPVITTQPAADEKYATIADIINERYDQADISHVRQMREGRAHRKAFRNGKLKGDAATRKAL